MAPFLCRWDFCTDSLPTLTALSSHLSEHIALERPVHVPAAKRRRLNGAWVLDDSSSTLSFPASATFSHPSLSQPSPSQPSQPFPSLPPLPSPHSQRQAGHRTRPSIDDFLPPADLSDLGLGVGVGEIDFDAYLRSPSPPRRVVSSTPLSQVPPPSQASQPPLSFGGALQPSPNILSAATFTLTAHPPGAQLPAGPSQTSQRSDAQPSDASSGALVSPPNSMPPPTQPPPPDSSASTNASPRASLQFGAASAETPRRVSAGGVGFDWGMGK